MPTPLTWSAVAAETVTSDADIQDFDRVHWAKCQARAERYEEEVKLSVEEMGRTLRYFEWKRDWWLSLKPKHSSPNYPFEIQQGLRAYASRQSHLYDELVTLFVAHWRAFLAARSLGSSWLGQYTSRPDLKRVCDRRKVDNGSRPTAANVPGDSNLPINPESLMDAPLDSGSEDHREGGGMDSDVEGDMGDYLDADDMFADE
jgi:hypothetical protein